MTELNEEKVVLRCQRGEREGFELLLTKYQNPLFGFIRGMIRDRSLAEDLLQELFLRVIKGIKKLKSPASFKSWLYKIATNLCKDSLRKKRPVSLSVKVGDEIELQDYMTAQENPPEEIVDRHLFQEKVQVVIESLPLEQREVLLLRIYSGLSFKEIASMQRCPLNTALARMRYALLTLRAKIKE